MYNMDISLGGILFQFGSVILIFIVLTFIGYILLNQLRKMFNNSLKLNELLPEEKIHTLRQIYYLIIMALCILNIFYSITSSSLVDLYYFIVFDVLLSIYFAILVDKSTRKGKIIWLLLVPYGSLSFLLFSFNIVILLDFFHVLIFVYFAKIYYDKFKHYTYSNGLGIAIVLLFIIIFSSFFIVQFAENVNALDSLVMISNQFTGNGFSVFGKSIPGKLNSLLLVWGGYVISGAGTATLTAAILLKHFNKKFEELERLIEEDDE